MARKPRKTESNASENNQAQNQIEPIAALSPETHSVPESKEPDSAKRPQVRIWSERFIQPVNYRKFVAVDQSRKERIFFQFDLPQGQSKPEEIILNVIREHKHTPEGYPTGLHFEHDRIHGPVWKFPNTLEGRTAADSLEAALDKLAKKMESCPNVC